MENTFNEPVFLSLPEDSKVKVECIYYIATVLKEKRLPQLTVSDFDKLYDKSVDDLRSMSGNIKEMQEY